MTSTQHRVDTVPRGDQRRAQASPAPSGPRTPRLDATVPHWRFECDGAEAVTAELSGWYGGPTTIEAAVRRPIPGGEAVELDLTWVEGGVPHAAHQVHLITVDGDRISRDTVFCGGRWPAALLAEMEAARGN